jgi:hypothetical protein
VELKLTLKINDVTNMPRVYCPNMNEQEVKNMRKTLKRWRLYIKCAISTWKQICNTTDQRVVDKFKKKYFDGDKLNVHRALAGVIKKFWDGKRDEIIAEASIDALNKNLEITANLMELGLHILRMML